MEIDEFVEMSLLEKRISVLQHKKDLVSDEQLDQYPVIDFTLREVSDVWNLISSLKEVVKVYGRD